MTSNRQLLDVQRAAARQTASLVVVLGGLLVATGLIFEAAVLSAAVVERRSEIGVRRAVGATRGAVGLQFIIEASVIALAGAVVADAAGIAVTAVYAADLGLAPRDSMDRLPRRRRPGADRGRAGWRAAGLARGQGRAGRGGQVVTSSAHT